MMKKPTHLLSGLIGFLLFPLLIACSDSPVTATPRPATPTLPAAARQATIIAAYAATEAAMPTLGVEFIQSQEEIKPTPTPAPQPVTAGNLPPLDKVPAPANIPAGAKLLGSFSGINGGVTAAALSSDKNWLAFASRYQIWLVELASGKVQNYFTTYDQEERGATSLHWTADGRKFVAGTFHGGVNMWRWDSIDNRLRPGPARLRPNSGSATFGEQIEASFSPDGTLIGGLGNEGVLVIWDGETYAQLLNFNTDYAGFFAWSPDGKLIIDEYLKTHNLTTGRSAVALSVVRITGDRPQGVAWSPDGKMVAASAEDFKLARFQAPTLAQPLINKMIDRKEYEDSSLIPRENLKLGRKVAFSPDSRWLAVANVPDLGKISVWEAAGGKFLFEISSGNKALNTLSWPVSGFLMAGGDDGFLRFWQIN
jgi:WD40 repeat protein